MQNVDLLSQPHVVAGFRKSEPEPLVVKPYTVKDLGGIYGVDPRTFLKWIKPFESRIGERNGRFYTVMQVEIILLALGVPYKLGEG